MQLSDSQLLRLSSGDESAGKSLVKRYQRLIYAIHAGPVSMTTTPPSISGGIYHPFKKLNDADDPARLHAWLVTTARRKTRGSSYLRRSRGSSSVGTTRHDESRNSRTLLMKRSCLIKPWFRLEGNIGSERRLRRWMIDVESLSICFSTRLSPAVFGNRSCPRDVGGALVRPRPLSGKIAAFCWEKREYVFSTAGGHCCVGSGFDKKGIEKKTDELRHSNTFPS